MHNKVSYLPIQVLN